MKRRSVHKLIGMAALGLALFAPGAWASAHERVMVIHGGGFIGGSPKAMTPITEWLSAHGHQSVAARYPLREGAVAAYRGVRSEAKRSGVTSAIGLSVGGHLAMRLAERGLVDRAIAIAPPVKSTWPYTRRAILEDEGLMLPVHLPSVRFTQRSGRVRIIHDVLDRWVPFKGSDRLATRSDRVSLSAIDYPQGNRHMVPLRFVWPVLLRFL